MGKLYRNINVGAVYECASAIRRAAGESDGGAYGAIATALLP